MYQRSHVAAALSCDDHGPQFVDLTQRINLECGISIKVIMFC